MKKTIKISVGDVFGTLTVVSVRSTRVLISNTQKIRYRIRCKCICDKLIWADKCDLFNGKRTNCSRNCKYYVYCGRSTTEQAEANYITVFKASNKHRGITCALTDEQIITISRLPCFYCNIESSVALNYTRSFSSDDNNRRTARNGIDRLNSNIGYTILNSVPCCYTCNLAKHTQSLDEFLIKIKRIYENLRLENLLELEEVA